LSQQTTSPNGPSDDPDHLKPSPPINWLTSGVNSRRATPVAAKIATALTFSRKGDSAERVLIAANHRLILPLNTTAFPDLGSLL
jgi:hypothetical protein